jgi:predicted nuclease of predicted toxin-antitoxin system
MQIRLYVDEDAMARALVQGLRARGVDVITVLDAGMSEQDDSAQLDYATTQGRVLYTFNVGDFCQLHSEYLAQGKNHAGVIVVHRQRYSVGEQMRRRLSVINTKSAEEMEQYLHFL